MTDIILNGTSVVQACDSTATLVDGTLVAIINGQPDCHYPAALGVTVVSGITLPSPWPGYGYTYSAETFTQNPAPAVQQTPTQMYLAQLALGIALTSTGNSALNATYTTPVPNGPATNAAAQANITAIEASIGAGRGLPGGGSTFNYYDSSGASHAFDTTHWNEAATAFMNYSYALQDWYLGGCSGSSPSNQITIA